MQYPLIDVLRAVAALLVMIYHVTALGQWTKFAEPVWGLPMRQGWIGVDLFLVISGFVITLSAARERERNPAQFRRAFMYRRLRRVVPLYLLTCAAYVLLVRPEILLRPTTEFIVQVVSHALFLQNLSHLTHGVINGVTWSLALEMQFYVALILSIGGLLRLGPGRVLVLLVGLSWAWRYATTLILVPGQAIPHWQVIYTTELPGTLDAFGMGIVLALLVFKGQGFWAQRLLPGWKNCLLWLNLTVALMSFTGVVFFPVDNYWGNLGMVVFWRTLLAMGFGAALATAITCPLRGGGLLRPVRYLGTISYGLYLWHFPVLTALLVLPSLRGGRLFVVLFESTTVLAALSWHLMEKHWVSHQSSNPPKIR